jgi:hypothetical protein
VSDAIGEKPLIAQGRDREEFDAFYRYATDRGTLFYTAGGQVSARRLRWVCTGPISYAGHEQLRREIDTLRAFDPGEDAFLTSTAPASLPRWRTSLRALLEVKAQAYLIEGANARHEHEWAVWRDVRLPGGKILIPEVVTHSTDVVERPDLVAQRIERFASVVGAGNVMAGTDCGFGGRTHPQIAWAKLRSLTEGANRASRALGFGS